MTYLFPSSGGVQTITKGNFFSPFLLLPSSSWLAYLIDLEDGGDVFLRDAGLILTGLHGVISESSNITLILRIARFLDFVYRSVFWKL